jgi:hypothetical protein
MPLEFGLVSSHAPSLFATTYAGWDSAWKRFRGSTPQPPEVEAEGPERIAEFVRRTAAAFAEQRARLAAYDPDVLIVVAGDQDEWFDAAHVPNVMIYAGDDDVQGYHNFGADDEEPRLLPWEHPDRFGVRLKVDRALGETLLRGLVRDGFDISISRKLPAYEGRRKAPHALVRPLPLILSRPDIPIVPVMMKTVERSPAVLTGGRALALGRAIARICRDLPQRIAIYGSGGMSHDPLGPRACWVDEPLDRWFIERLVAGAPDDLAPLYTFRSAATESGTGELRTWLPVAGAMDALSPGCHATLIDYFAAYKSTAGCGWMVWENSRTMAATTSGRSV